MNYTIIHREEIKVIGITVKTTNENNQAQEDIGKLWQQFISEKIPEQIPHALSKDTIAVYTEYEKDFTKPYRYTLGVKVENVDTVPQGMQSIVIPAAKYAAFSVVGKMPEALLQTWQAIWNTNIERIYTNDFEEYTKEGVTIYIAIA